MKKYFVTSDIHNFYDELVQSLNTQNFDISNLNHYLIACGDLFDRGTKSLELLKFVQSLGDRFIYVRGNHEDLLHDCVNEIVQGLSISRHHISNGTLSTIAQLTGIDFYELSQPRRSQTINQEVWNRMNPILKWIDNKSVNYYELGDYIFVHGWIPCGDNDSHLTWWEKNYIFDPDWNKTPNPNNVADLIKYDSKWKEARWINGMDAWHQGIKIPGKTIVCGHWHVSFYWSILKQKYKEFPPKNRKDWQKSFQIVEDDGIIALDACTAYSGIVNCKVIEIND